MTTAAAAESSASRFLGDATSRKAVTPSPPPPEAYKKALMQAEARDRHPSMTATLELSDGSRDASPQSRPEPPSPSSKRASRTAAAANRKNQQKEEAMAATRAAQAAIDRAEAVANEGEDPAVLETERDEMVIAVRRIQDESRRRQDEMYSTLHAVSKWFSDADPQEAIDEERASEIGASSPSRSRRGGGAARGRQAPQRGALLGGGRHTRERLTARFGGGDDDTEGDGEDGGSGMSYSAAMEAAEARAAAGSGGAGAAPEVEEADERAQLADRLAEGRERLSVMHTQVRRRQSGCGVRR